MPALLPNSVDLNHYDTKLPSDADARGYFVWKWTIGVQICKVVDYWTSVRIPSYDGGLCNFDSVWSSRRSAAGH